MRTREEYEERELQEARRIREAKEARETREARDAYTREASEPRTARDADEAAAAWLHRDRLSIMGDEENPIDSETYDFDTKAIQAWKFVIDDDHRLKGVSNFEYWEASLKRSLLEVEVTPSQFPHLPKRCQAVILNQIFASLCPELQKTYIKTTNLQRLWSAIKTNQTRTDTDAQNRAVKEYLKFQVQKNETAAAYIARFREVVMEVRTVGLMGVSLVDMGNKFIKGIKPRYPDINQHLLPIRYGLEQKPEEFLDAAINLLKGLEAEGATQHDRKGQADDSKGFDKKQDRKGSNKPRPKEEKKDPEKKKSGRRVFKHEKCKVCDRGHSGECFGKDWKPGQPKTANVAITAVTPSSSMNNQQVSASPRGEPTPIVMAGASQQRVIDLPSPYYQIGGQPGPASFGATAPIAPPLLPVEVIEP
jgi:hypothetical protein